jgi:hypothetical protein
MNSVVRMANMLQLYRLQKSPSEGIILLHKSNQRHNGAGLAKQVPKNSK